MALQILERVEFLDIRKLSDWLMKFRKQFWKKSDQINNFIFLDLNPSTGKEKEAFVIMDG